MNKQINEIDFREKYSIYELMALLWWDKLSWDDKFRMFTDAFGHKIDFRFPDGSHLIYLMSIHGDNPKLKGFPKPPARYFTCSPDQFFEAEFIQFIKYHDHTTCS